MKITHARAHTTQTDREQTLAGDIAEMLLARAVIEEMLWDPTQVPDVLIGEFLGTFSPTLR